MVAEGGEKRSKTAHRTKSQMKRHGVEYGGRPEQKKKRAMRNQARREAIRDGKVKKGDGKDIHHVKPLRAGGTNAKSNRKVVAQSKNRAHGASRGRRGRQ